MTQHDKPYWFPAKRYGWGWGVPLCWQGWAVMAAYAALGALAGVVLSHRHPAAFVAVMLAATAVLIAICWAKGEPPRWRWGRD